MSPNGTCLGPKYPPGASNSSQWAIRNTRSPPSIPTLPWGFPLPSYFQPFAPAPPIQPIPPPILSMGLPWGFPLPPYSQALPWGFPYHPIPKPFPGASPFHHSARAAPQQHLRHRVSSRMRSSDFECYWGGDVKQKQPATLDIHSISTRMLHSYVTLDIHSKSTRILFELISSVYRVYHRSEHTSVLRECTTRV